MNDERGHIDKAGLIGVGLIGAVLGGAAVYFHRMFRAGDEPPIRVRGGSMYLDAGCGATWDMVGMGGKKWKLSRGTRSKEDYDVSIVTSSSNCTTKKPTGKKVRVEYSEGMTVRWVQLKAPGNKTMVEASDPLTPVNSGQTLMFCGSGHISKISVDSYVCDFSNATEFDHAVLSDF